MRNLPGRESSEEGSSAPETDASGAEAPLLDWEVLAAAYREAVRLRLTGAEKLRPTGTESTAVGD